MSEHNSLSKFKFIKIGVVIVSVLLILGIAIWFSITKYQSNLEQDILQKVEKISYTTQLPFDQQKLLDTTGITLGEVKTVPLEVGEAFSELKVNKGKIIVPGNSKVRLVFKTFCLDSDYGVPGSDVPIIFSYEKIDMPLFFETQKYLLENDDIDQSLIQDLIWDLSTRTRAKFDQLSEEEQQLSLKIDPSAKEKIDSYQYYRNISVKNFNFGENLPEETIAQPIPGTELYAKVNSTSGYDYTEIDIYNPSVNSQTIPIIKEGEGVLTLMPKNSIIKVSLDEMVFGVVAGKFDINNNFLKTPSDTGVILLSEKGKKVILKPNTEISLSNLARKLGQSEQENSYLQINQTQAANEDLLEGLQRKSGKPLPPLCHVKYNDKFTGFTIICGVRG